MVTELFGWVSLEGCEAGYHCRLELRCENARGKRGRGGEGKGRRGRGQTIYPDGCPGGGGLTGGAERWRWDEEPMFPCSENRSAEKGGCCSRPSQLVAPFHNSLIFDWTCRAWTGGEIDRIPTRGASLCGTSGHLLARVWLRAAPVFAHPWKNGTRHPTPNMAPLYAYPIVFPNLPTCKW